jgi:hypothetical protein
MRLGWVLMAFGLSFAVVVIMAIVEVLKQWIKSREPRTKLSPVTRTNHFWYRDH